MGLSPSSSSRSGSLSPRCRRGCRRGRFVVVAVVTVASWSLLSPRGRHRRYRHVVFVTAAAAIVVVVVVFVASSQSPPRCWCCRLAVVIVAVVVVVVASSRSLLLPWSPCRGRGRCGRHLVVAVVTSSLRSSCRRSRHGHGRRSWPPHRGRGRTVQAPSCVGGVPRWWWRSGSGPGSYAGVLVLVVIEVACGTHWRSAPVAAASSRSHEERLRASASGSSRSGFARHQVVFAVVEVVRLTTIACSTTARRRRARWRQRRRPTWLVGFSTACRCYVVTKIGKLVCRPGLKKNEVASRVALIC